MYNAKKLIPFFLVLTACATVEFVPPRDTRLQCVEDGRGYLNACMVDAHADTKTWAGERQVLMNCFKVYDKYVDRCYTHKHCWSK